MSFPTVAVVVPVYNGAADLPGLLAGLKRQRYPQERLEVWLVDNGSCDRTPTILQAVAQSHPQFHWLRYDAIQSSYAARNAGICASQSQIIAFTDVDCRPAPHWLGTLVQPFENSRVGIVAGEIKALASTTWLERYAERQQTLSQRHTLNHPFYPYGQTANLAIRATIFEQVGLFRPHLTSGGDADLCWRILQATPWQLTFVEEATIEHRHRRRLGDLHRQWYRYGCSNRYLHQLHGVELMRNLTLAETRYRLGRWLLKEIPQLLGRQLKGYPAGIDWLVTPLDLICYRARTLGQEQAQLPPEADFIPPR